MDFENGQLRDVRGIFTTRVVPSVPADIEFGLAIWLAGPAGEDFSGHITVADAAHNLVWQHPFQATMRPGGTAFMHDHIAFRAETLVAPARCSRGQASFCVVARAFRLTPVASAATITRPHTAQAQSAGAKLPKALSKSSDGQHVRVLGVPGTLPSPFWCADVVDDVASSAARSASRVAAVSAATSGSYPKDSPQSVRAHQ